MKTQNVSELYPVTLKFLKQQDELGLTRLLKAFEDQQFEADDQKNYFPRFLKSKNLPQAVLEIAHYEWCFHEVKSLDLGNFKQNMRGLFVNLSFQALQLGPTSAEALGVSIGLHAFWKPVSGDLRRRQISLFEKQVIDTLSDDAVFTVEGLINFLEDTPSESSEARSNPKSWSEILNQLLRDEIVIELKT